MTIQETIQDAIECLKLLLRTSQDIEPVEAEALEMAIKALEKESEGEA